MKDPARVVPRLALCLVLLAGAAPGTLHSQAAARHYVCDPCGLPCDSAVYDHPGTCPKCGMKLVDQEEARHAVEKANLTRKKAAILIFDGVQIIDYTGPYEVLGAAGFAVFTVAETKDPVNTAMGMTVVPKYTFADAPRPDVLVVPGGGVQGARGSAATLSWVKETAAKADITMSVCNGAFILASAGLLDGLTATTTAGRIEQLRSEYPKTKVVDNRRFVDNGRIITTAGLSSGIDGALHVVSRTLGNGTAQSVALGEEYDWRPESGFARAALADRLIPHVDLDAIGSWETVNTHGGTDRWELVLRGSSEKTAAQVMEHVGRALEADGKWTSVHPAATSSSGPVKTNWKFHGRDGASWTGAVSVEPVAGEDHKYTLRAVIQRAG